LHAIGGRHTDFPDRCTYDGLPTTQRRDLHKLCDGVQLSMGVLVDG
jgi:hypothetical protein